MYVKKTEKGEDENILNNGSTTFYKLFMQISFNLTNKRFKSFF